MNYSLTKKKAKELVEAKLSHFMGVSPNEATNEQGLRMELDTIEERRDDSRLRMAT